MLVFIVKADFEVATSFKKMAVPEKALISQHVLSK
jgi:hypothetical protein